MLTLGRVITRKWVPSGLGLARYQATSTPRRARHSIFIWKLIVPRLVHDGRRMCEQPNFCPLSARLKPVKTSFSPDHDLTAFLSHCRLFNNTVSTHNFNSLTFMNTIMTNESGIPRTLEKWKHFCTIYTWDESRDSLVGIATGYGLGNGIDSQQEQKIFLYFTASRPALGPETPAQWVPGALSLGVSPGREADHSPPSNAEVKNGGAIPPLSHVSSWHSA
jgi:hypothetical protein